MTEQLIQRPEQEEMTSEYQPAPTPEAVSAITVAETANFQGNWMLAQSERLATPDFIAKYDAMVASSLPGLKGGAPGVFEKAEQFESYHEGLRDSYVARHNFVHAATQYVPAITFGRGPAQVGFGGIEERGTVFTDAMTADGTPLTDRQKDIIAAHEAYHGMIKLPPSLNEEVIGGLDLQAYHEIVEGEGVKRPQYLLNPDELMARMAQLKNYYGMKGGEAFTAEHLAYAREHYVQDTGLDNSMSVMMRAVTPRTEPNFLHLMNTLPV